MKIITLRLATLALILSLPACFFSKKTQPEGTKVLRLVFRDDIKFGDPAQANDQLSAEFLGHVFEGLLNFSYLGRPNEVVPVLSENLPVIKDGGKTYTFRIRKGVHFQDDPAFPNGKGRELTAKDFIYSFKRFADPRSDSPNWWTLDGVVEGFNEWRDAIKSAAKTDQDTLFAKDIKGLQAPNSYTLIIRLKRPYPQLPFVLSMTHTTATAKEVVDKYGPEIISHPVGTGPFRLKEWVRGSKVVFEKNPTFRSDFYPDVGTDEARQKGLLKAAAQKLPFVDEIQFDIIKEEQPRWLKFRNNELDEVIIPNDNYTDTIDANGQLNPELSKLGLKLHKQLLLTTWWIEFNHKDSLLGKNLKLRQALSYAFDRKRALALLQHNRGILADSPLPPTIEGGAEQPTYPYDYSIEKAKALLAEAGYPGGKGLPDLSFDLRGPGTTNRLLGELLQDNYSKIGVNLKVLANSFPEALEKQKRSRFQITLGGWAADYPDPENFMQNFISDNAAPGPNSSNFSNKEYDKLYVQIRTELPSPDRKKAIRKMVEILQKEAAVSFFYVAMEYWVTQPWVKNYYPNVLYYGKSKFLDVDLVEKSRPRN